TSSGLLGRASCPHSQHFAVDEVTDSAHAVFHVVWPPVVPAVWLLLVYLVRVFLAVVMKRWNDLAQATQVDVALSKKEHQRCLNRFDEVNQRPVVVVFRVREWSSTNHCTVPAKAGFRAGHVEQAGHETGLGWH